MLLKNYFKESHLFTRRTLILAIFFGLVLLILIGRLFHLQIIEHDRYTTLSNRNQITIMPISPNRGLIYDRKGVLLSENIPVFNLEIIPDRTDDVATTIANVQKIIPISEEELAQFNKIRKQSRRFDSVPLKNNLSEEEVARFYVDQYQFPGVSVNARLMRHYPLGPGFSHVLGYVGRISSTDLPEIDRDNYQMTDYIGKAGLEKTLETALHGKSGFQEAEVNASGRIIRILQTTPPIHGDDIQLTIDAALQLTATEALGENVGAVVAIDPSNGEILALVSNPGYDPNLFVNGLSVEQYQELRDRPSQPLFNRTIQGQYTIGSTIKPFLAMAGLKSGRISNDTWINDQGWFKIANSEHVFHDMKRGGHGIVDLTTAIIVSCNIFFFEMSLKLGIHTMADALHQFGFGEKTNIELPAERVGVLPSPAWKKKRFNQSWYPGDTVNAGIGQGYVLATPLQLAAATATLATRGIRYQPHLVLKRENQNEIAITQPILAHSLDSFPAEHWQTVIQAMEGVIRSASPPGTGSRFGRNPPYSVAAKTGTAEVDKPKQYDGLDQLAIPYQYRDTSLFIAFAPVDAPKIAIAVIVEHDYRQAQLVARRVIDQYLIPPSGGVKIGAVLGAEKPAIVDY